MAPVAPNNNASLSLPPRPNGSMSRAGKMIRSIVMRGSGSESVSSTYNDEDSKSLTFVTSITTECEQKKSTESSHLTSSQSDMEDDTDDRQPIQPGLTPKQVMQKMLLDQLLQEQAEKEKRQQPEDPQQENLQPSPTQSSKNSIQKKTLELSKSASSAAPHYVEVQLEPVYAPLEAIPKLLLEDVLSNNGKMVEEAMDRLARKCRKSATIREEAYRAGGHAVIVMVMRQWRNNKVIQSGGCRCMTSLTTEMPLAKKSLAMIGGVESVVVAMTRYPESKDVQCHALGALVNMLCADGQGEKDHAGDDAVDDVSLEMSTLFVHKLNGVSMVVDSMKRFPKEAKIQLGGCTLLLNLAREQSFVTTIMQFGAVAAVGASLESHPKDTNIKNAAGSFMKNVFA